MIQAIRNFLGNNDAGQDLAEYCLLVAMLALVAFGILYKVGGGLDGIWASLNAGVSTANSTARTPAH